MERYDRQMRVKNIGKDGQEKLLTKTILIVGVGAIGSYAAEICARMGFGKLILIDRDYVELSNLQRQSLFTEQDALDKQAKSYAASKALQLINSDITIEYIVDDANVTSLTPYVGTIDYILDCTDNFMTRDFLNQFCFSPAIKFRGFSPRVLEITRISCQLFRLTLLVYTVYLVIFPKPTQQVAILLALMVR